MLGQIIHFISQGDAQFPGNLIYNLLGTAELLCSRKQLDLFFIVFHMPFFLETLKHDQAMYEQVTESDIRKPQVKICDRFHEDDPQIFHLIG